MSNSSDIFLNAMDIDDLEEREQYVQEACDGNSELLQQVLALIAADLKEDPFFDKPISEDLRARMNPMASAIASSPASSGITFELEDSDEAGEAYTDESDEDLLEEVSPFLEKSDSNDGIGRIGRYQLLEILGAGAFGIVLKAVEDSLERTVALKVLRPSVTTSLQTRRRFLREARALAKIKHPNVITIYAVEDSPLPLISMEFIDGCTLDDRILDQGRLSAIEIHGLTRQIAEGLDAVHNNGLIHRDLKPANILLEGPEFSRAILSDFGMVKIEGEVTMTASSSIPGTPLFMSPEQINGDKLDHRTDLFSLGSLIYQMASGKSAFAHKEIYGVLRRVLKDTPKSLQDLNQDIPDWLNDLVFQLLEKLPERRIQTASEVIAHLEKKDSTSINRILSWFKKR